MIKSIGEEIGGGANSKIFEAELVGSNTKIVLKEFYMSNDYRINGTVEKFEKIRSKHFPKLNFLQKLTFQNKNYLATEHINLKDDFIYVCSNSIHNSRNTSICKAESQRRENKLDEILDFENFLNEVLRDLKRITFDNISLYFDCYFFGTYLRSESTISYKIVDLDNIEFWDKYESDNFINNKSNFKDAIIGFVNCFVNDKYINKHLKIIEKVLK
ncbi:hypothetical protein [Flavobacterium sp. DSR2-3-3]|uniref:hypothetical protein n=1 Tax=Flavobacterium sp. DSR2-3-3 TaxID=2804632 RepID=UPI003CE924B9